MKKRKERGGWEIEDKEKKNYLVTRHPDLPHRSSADEFQMLLGRDAAGEKEEREKGKSGRKGRAGEREEREKSKSGRRGRAREMEDDERKHNGRGGGEEGES